MMSTERKYDARITRVYGGDGPENLVFYDAVAVDTVDVVEMVNVAPFRRWIFSDGVDPPTIKAAHVGDDCEIAMCGGQARLRNVPEQYLAGPCDQT